MFFVTRGTSGIIAITNQTSAAKRIPKQLLAGDANILKQAQSVSSGVLGLFMSNVAVSFLLSSNIGAAWSLINFSQMIMTIPLMNIAVPANLQAVFFSLQDMVSFNFIPVSSLPMY